MSWSTVAPVSSSWSASAAALAAYSTAPVAADASIAVGTANGYVVEDYVLDGYIDGALSWTVVSPVISSWA